MSSRKHGVSWCRGAAGSRQEGHNPWVVPDHDAMFRAFQREQTLRATRIAEQARLEVHLKSTQASEMQARNAHLKGILNPRRLLKKEADK